MRPFRLGAGAVLVLVALATPCFAQQPEGQPPRREYSILCTAHAHPKIQPGWAEIGRAGGLDASGQGAPAEVVELTHGLVEITVPTLMPMTFGWHAEPIHEFSPAEAFDDFGPDFGAGSGSDRAPALHAALDLDLALTGTRQFRHMGESELVRLFLDRSPWDVATWIAEGIIPLGPKTTAVLRPFGAAPKDLFPIALSLASLPPVSPTGDGRLIGINLVLQATVLDTNGSSPTDPKLRLTNAVGIRAMVGPPIKIELDGPNFGPRQSLIGVRGELMTPSLRVGYSTGGGAARSVPVALSDSTSGSFSVPADARDGLLEFSSATGSADTLGPQLLIVTHGAPQPLANVTTPTLVSNADADGVATWGFTVVGTLGQNASLLSVAPPAALSSYDLELRIYPFAPGSSRAGYGNAVPVDVAASAPDENGVASVPVEPDDDGGPLVIDGVGAVLVREYPNLAGELELSLAADAAVAASAPVLIVARLRPSAAPPTTGGTGAPGEDG